MVYLDPPYVPRADDNCYIKRYHFLKGLSCYWQGLPVDPLTKVKKIAKRYTPFSYRRTAVEAFDRMFSRFAKSQNTTLLFVTDGSTWTARRSDLRKIVERQNQGKIARIYTMKMADELLADLKSLKGSMGL